MSEEIYEEERALEIDIAKSVCNDKNYIVRVKVSTTKYIKISSHIEITNEEDCMMFLEKIEKFL